MPRGVYKRTEEMNRNMSESHKNPSPETRRKMSNAQKGKHISAEYRRKISETLKDKYLSVEFRRMMSEAKKGKKLSEEHKQKLSKANKGKHHTEEAKKKMSNAQKGKFSWNKGKHPSEETRRKMSKSRKGKQHTAETKKKMREARIKYMIKNKDKFLETLIEIVMEKQLKLTNFNYEKQKYIKNIGIVDFFLTDFNIIIECDGDYWHTKEGVQQKDVDRDFKAMLYYNYKTIRFWEHKIENEPKNCIREIKKYIARTGI